MAANKTKAPVARGKDEKKETTPAKGQQKNALVPSGGAKLPASLAAKMKADSGKGVSQKQEDNLVPMITIMQDGSPQVKKGHTKFIEDAEAGCIWLKGLDQPFIPGEEGILVQSCHFDKGWTEWTPRSKGGGFIARHAERPAGATQHTDPQNPKKKFWLLQNGNEVVETRYHVVRVWLEDGRKIPYFLPLAGSGHSFSKDWMFRMNNVPSGDGIAPSWAKVWRLKLGTRTNTDGTWFMFTPEDAGWVETEEDYDAGAQLFNAFETGAGKLDEKQMDDANRGEDGGSNAM